MSIEVTTCQICGRPIKSKSGLIAHHGYRRPGGGWQTHSCMGARYKPYEESCDRIQDVIDGTKRHLEWTERTLVSYLAEPPATITYEDRRHETVVVERPENFTHGSYRASIPSTYEHLFDSGKRKMERDIAECKFEIEFLTKRLAAWVAPVTEPASEVISA